MPKKSFGVLRRYLRSLDPARVGLFVVLAVAAVLLFGRLGNGLLWQDEAQTALLAETVLKHGVPLGYDGTNYFSMAQGIEYGDHYLWRYSPWLPFYLTAASFELFGIGTWAARLPFAAMGLATIGLTFLLAKRLSGDARVGLVSAGLLSLCVPFLLLTRQCRFYGAVAFFSQCALYAYARLLDGERKSFVFLGLAATGLFYSHYLYYGTLFVAIFLHLAFRHRNLLKEGIAAVTLSLPLTIPGILWHARMPYRAMYVLGYQDPAIGITQLWWLVRDGVRYIVPPLWIAVALGWGVFVAVRGQRRLDTGSRGFDRGLFLAIWLGVTLIFLALLNGDYYFRHLAPAIAVLCIACAWMTVLWMHASRWLGVAGLVIFVAHQPLTDYLYEITHDYIGPMDGYVRFLRENAKPTDVVWATLEEMPIKFYTHLRVISSMTGEDLSKAPPPDWLILRRFAFNQPDVDARAYIKEHFPRTDFEAIQLPYPDIAFQNREDPEHHRYRTAADAPPIIIFRRKKSA